MLKKLLITMLVAISLNANAQEQKPTLYYFYSNSRCSNCIKFEKYTQEAAQTLPVELKKINIEEKGNENYIKDYKLYTKSVVISDNNGNYKSLAGIWQNVYNKDKFKLYIINEVNNFIGANK